MHTCMKRLERRLPNVVGKTCETVKRPRHQHSVPLILDVFSLRFAWGSPACRDATLNRLRAAPKTSLWLYSVPGGINDSTPGTAKRHISGIALYILGSVVKID